MIVKAHKTQDGRRLVAVCDSGLIGKKVEEGKLQLDFTSGFYKGEEKNEEKVIALIRGSYLVILAGEKSVKLALKLGIIEEKNIIKIKGIPHAQALLG